MMRILPIRTPKDGGTATCPTMLKLAATILIALLPIALPGVRAADAVIVPVDSPAFVFSPANWTGDAGRVGTRFRQTWNPGAYFRVTWTTTSRDAAAKLLLDTSTYPPQFKRPLIAYCIDGVWKSKVPCAGEVAILINYGTNDGLHKSDPSDTRASINQGLAALRRSAPEAQILVIIPFGQYYAKELKEAVAGRKQGSPPDTKIAIIDLGPSVARGLAAKNGLLGGLHPNDRGHALFAAQIIPQVMSILRPGAQ